MHPPREETASAGAPPSGRRSPVLALAISLVVVSLSPRVEEGIEAATTALLLLVPYVGGLRGRFERLSWRGRTLWTVGSAVAPLAVGRLASRLARQG